MKITDQDHRIVHPGEQGTGDNGDLSGMNDTSRKRGDGEGPSKGFGCSLVLKRLSPGISRVWQTARKQSGGGIENIGRYVKNAE